MVTASIREMILTGEIEGGVQLRQRDLAAQLGVSPTPVREALRRLESEGLVVSGQHRTSTVVNAEFGAVEENYRIRAGLESLGASLAAERITDEELDRLEEINDRLKELGDEGGERQALNADFHFQMYVAAQSPSLLALLRLLWRAFPGGPQALRPAAESCREHDELLQALRDRDPDRAEQVANDHILGAIKYLDRADPGPPASPR
ncbi:MAG: GntR family transcriptional regulator [Actinobacteria bacterium]|nr:GntR family transcriptional regulator [Actinomycetota bacterium]